MILALFLVPITTLFVINLYWRFCLKDLISLTPEWLNAADDLNNATRSINTQSTTELAIAEPALLNNTSTKENDSITTNNQHILGQFTSIEQLEAFALLNAFKAIKVFTLISFIITLWYSFYLWCNTLYPFININEYLTENSTLLWFDTYTVPQFSLAGGIVLFELTPNFNLPFISLTIIVLMVALLVSWHSDLNMTLFCSCLLFLEFCLVGAFSCTNLFIFLLFFEASALPIFILMLYCGSSRQERFKASYYFLFYTFYGSMSLLIVLMNFYSLNQLDFSTETPAQIYNETTWILLFLAFAVKLPLFPFHLWLPFAHVEASTTTSIILAALMLKLGGYGLVQFMLPLFPAYFHYAWADLVMLLCILGCVLGSLNSLRQLDLKRFIAFSSIMHMSFGTFGVFTFSDIGVKGFIYMMLSHGIVSLALFFLVGNLVERHHSRSVFAYSGLLLVMPVFSFFFLVMSLANIGFPGTSGFIPEFAILLSLFSQVNTGNILFSLPLILFSMFLTTTSSFNLYLRLFFGVLKTNFISGFTDLNKKDFIILLTMFLIIIFTGVFDILFSI